MQTVTVTRTLDADPAAVRAAMDDTAAFMEAGGFDEATLHGDVLEITNRVGIATLSLTLERVEDGDARQVWEARDGIFEEMRTTYAVEPHDGGDGSGEGCTVTARTAFAVDVALVGGLMDATVIRRQRRKELATQLDWLERAVAGDEGSGVTNGGPGAPEASR